MLNQFRANYAQDASRNACRFSCILSVAVFQLQPQLKWIDKLKLSFPSWNFMQSSSTVPDAVQYTRSYSHSEKYWLRVRSLNVLKAHVRSDTLRSARGIFCIPEQLQQQQQQISHVNITNEIFTQSISAPFSYSLLDRPVLTDTMYLLHNPHNATTGRLLYRLLSTAAVTGCHANVLAETVKTDPLCTWCGR
jgi:hypothetical protein